MSDEVQTHHEKAQYATFYLENRIYGLEVTKVQEITKLMHMTPVPKAPTYVSGLINLRGQIASAIDLRNFLGLPTSMSEDSMNVVCHVDGFLMSFIVDRVGDVMEFEPSQFEPCPQTISPDIRKYMLGVYKTSDQLVSIIQIQKILDQLKTFNFQSQPNSVGLAG